MPFASNTLFQSWWPGCGQWSSWGWGMMLFMVLFWILVLAAAIALVWWLVGLGRQTREVGSSTRRPEDILKDRYARGEIDRDTYTRMLDDLQRGPAG